MSTLKTRNSWREKLENAPPRKIETLAPNAAKRLGGRIMLIAHPTDIVALINKVPKGRLITVEQIRRRLAEQFGAETTCPLTTGIFLRIIAETAEEDRAQGKARIIPYWRVIRNDGALNEKIPGGVDRHAALLRSEGHAMARPSAKRSLCVLEFERRLVRD